MSVARGNRITHYYSLCLFIFIAYGAYAGSAQSQTQPENPLAKKTILILNAVESNIPAFLKIDRGLSAALQSGGIGIRNQFYEHLELRRNPSPEHRKLIVELMHHRYDRHKIDFIVTIYPEALRFLLDEAQAIFPDAPILAILLPEGFELPKRDRRIIPHLVVPDLERTLEIALKLVPKTERVYVVGGVHPMDRWFEDRARHDFKKWEGRLEFRYLSDQPLEEILETVSTAPPDSIVYLNVFGTDVTGKSLTSVEVGRQLTRVTKAPVFGSLDTLLGTGIVGGSLISLETVGTKAGELAVDILSGARVAEDIPKVMEVPQLNIFDWRQLRHWNLSESALPRGSTIINREFSLWDFKYYAIGALAFILAQSFLIAGSLWQKRGKKWAEASLQQKSEELDQFFNISIDLLCIANTDGYFLRLNPTWERTLSYSREDLMAKRFLEFVHPDDLERTQEVVSALKYQRKVIHFENRYRCKDGTYRWLEWSAALNGNLIYASARDITERLKAEAENREQREELAHMTRIATIGELTTSLAHEINQPLTAIQSNAEAAKRFLAQSTPDLNEVGQILEDIIRDDKRASQVVQKVRALVRKEKPQTEFMDLNVTIEEVVRLIRGESLLHGLYISMELNPDLKGVRGDRVQLQQVILNLILNSVAAMRNASEIQRKIRVRTSMPDDRNVRVSVTDFGTGIDENNIERLFEPFYTTKPDGLGMGLSISRTIIEAHGGTIKASNNPEGGATFALTLPAYQGEAS